MLDIRKSSSNVRQVQHSLRRHSPPLHHSRKILVPPSHVLQLHVLFFCQVFLWRDPLHRSCCHVQRCSARTSSHQFNLFLRSLLPFHSSHLVPPVRTSPQPCSSCEFCQAPVHALSFQSTTSFRIPNTRIVHCLHFGVCKAQCAPVSWVAH